MRRRKSEALIEIPVIITAQSYNYYAAAGLIILLLAGFVYHFRVRLFSRKKEYTLEELELEKEKIFQAIRGFEKHISLFRMREARGITQAVSFDSRRSKAKSSNLLSRTLQA